MLRLIFFILLFYFIYKISKIILSSSKNIFSNYKESSKRSKFQEENKSNIIDADFEELDDNKK